MAPPYGYIPLFFESVGQQSKASKMVHIRSKCCTFIVIFHFRMLKSQKREFSMFKTHVEFELSFEGKNWNYLMYTLSKLGKFPTFTFIFGFFFNTNAFCRKTNQASNHELLTGGDNLISFHIQAVPRCWTKMRPNSMNPNINITSDWKCINISELYSYLPESWFEQTLIYPTQGCFHKSCFSGLFFCWKNILQKLDSSLLSNPGPWIMA